MCTEIAEKRKALGSKTENARQGFETLGKSREEVLTWTGLSHKKWKTVATTAETLSRRSRSRRAQLQSDQGALERRRDDLQHADPVKQAKRTVSTGAVGATFGVLALGCTAM